MHIPCRLPRHYKKTSILLHVILENIFKIWLPWAQAPQLPMLRSSAPSTLTQGYVLEWLFFIWEIIFTFEYPAQMLAAGWCFPLILQQGPIAPATYLSYRDPYHTALTFFIYLSALLIVMFTFNTSHRDGNI